MGSIPTAQKVTFGSPSFRVVPSAPPRPATLTDSSLTAKSERHPTYLGGYGRRSSGPGSLALPTPQPNPLRGRVQRERFTLHTAKLTDVLSRARAAILGNTTTASTAPATPSPEQFPRPDPSRPTIRLTAPPVPRVLPSYPSAADCRESLKLSRGAARLWTLLHRLAVDCGKARQYGNVPHAVTFHLPACAVAVALNYTERHTYTLADELSAAGLIAGGGHAQNVNGLSRYDGTLWKVRTVPGHVPQVAPDEWKFDWRPDFAADYYGKRSSKTEISGLEAKDGGKAVYAALLARAAVPGVRNPPAVTSPENCGKADLHAIAADLPGLVHAHPKDRHAAVTRLASRLTTALNEPERHRQWCRAIYAALNAENQLRPGLQQLALQLTRLAVDLREGAPWKRPGAVLASRLT